MSTSTSTSPSASTVQTRTVSSGDDPALASAALIRVGEASNLVLATGRSTAGGGSTTWPSRRRRDSGRYGLRACNTAGGAAGVTSSSDVCCGLFCLSTSTPQPFPAIRHRKDRQKKYRPEEPSPKVPSHLCW